MKITPNLFIPGAPKSGTSSLHDYLNLHPLIEMSNPKETHNYAIESRFINRYNKDFNLSYKNVFSKKLDVIYYGESSTIHMITPSSPKRIYSDNPNAKIIFIFRDPIKRILSHFNWMNSLGYVHKPFLSEIKEWLDQNINPDVSFGGNFKNYSEFSKYGKYLKRYIDTFGFENILVITSESLKIRPQVTLNSCFTFLGLQPFNIVEIFENNQTKELEIIKKSKLSKTVLNIIPFPIKKILNNKLKLSNKVNKLFFTAKINKHQISDEEILFLRSYFDEDFKEFQELTGQKYLEWDFIQ